MEPTVRNEDEKGADTQRSPGCDEPVVDWTGGDVIIEDLDGDE